jgi:hypothetical protein
MRENELRTHQVWVVTGGRNFTSQETFLAHMRELVADHGLPAQIVHRGHVGADAMVEAWATENNVETLVVRTDHAAHGTTALTVANDSIMMLRPTLVVIFFGGLGAGGLDRLAREQGIPVINVVRVVTNTAPEKAAETPAAPEAAE